MNRQVGLWIDHRRSVIVTIENEIEVVREIRSNIEKHARFSSGTHSKKIDSSAGATAEDMRDRQYGSHLNDFYDGIISFIRAADRIWIFGPGEAKVEFRNRLKLAELEERIVGLDTVGKMTDQQIAAKVRARFPV